MRKALREVKRKLDGSSRHFDLELWYKSDQVVVGRWIAPAGNPYGVPAGSFSWGVWPLEDCFWGAYRIHRADGGVVKYRLDAVLGNKMIDEHTLEFQDLLLDAIAERDEQGRARLVKLEDENEVEEAYAKGLLDEVHTAKLKQFQTHVQGSLGSILDTVDAHILRAIHCGLPSKEKGP